MQIYTLASGSSGNSILISGGGTHILVDAGISCRKITGRLKEAGVDPCDLSAIVVTHTHSDHIDGIPVFTRKLHLPVYLTEPASRDLLRRAPTMDERLFRFIVPGVPFTIGGLELTSFSTPHDAPGSQGYVIRAEGKGVAVVTDLGYLADSVVSALTGIDLAILECNHDVDWLRHGPYPFPLQERILGPEGHLSNETCAQLAIHLARLGAGQVILAHLSPENNSEERAWETVSRMLWEADCRTMSVYVAPQDTLSRGFAL